MRSSSNGRFLAKSSFFQSLRSRLEVPVTGHDKSIAFRGLWR